MLELKNVKKRYGDRDVVKDITFSVNQKESFGLLGPNGAGKSTTISMICGLIPADQGDIQVGGYSVKQNPQQVKQLLGVVPQDIALYPTMSAKENLMFWGQMYGLPGTKLKQRTSEVLEIVGLTDRAKDPIGSFSGGMKRRINIGAALMHKPKLLIMDEPTVGIDPQSRNHILETVKHLNREGMTVIYTSHYMEEVEFLCNRIAIIDHGEVIAIGTKKELCDRLVGGTSIDIKVNVMDLKLIPQIESMVNIQKVIANPEERQLSVFASDARQVIGSVITTITSAGVQVLAMDVKEPNLETVFLQLTGRTLRE